jgi:alkaline phosphatase D
MSGDDALTRRSLVAQAALAGGAVMLGGPVDLADAARRRRRRPPPLASGGEFSQGVLSGLPGQRAITLWTHLAEVERPGKLEVEIATDRGFRRVVHRQRVALSAARNDTARVRVISKRLKPGRRYYYRFEDRNGSSPVGRFQTLRPPDSREPVRIGFFSCQLFAGGWFTAHDGLAREDLDFVVCLGDYFYEMDYYGLREDESSGPRRAGEPERDAESLADYRAKFQTVRSDRFLRSMHAKHAFLPIWDDHEVENNYEGRSAGPEGYDPHRRVPFDRRRANAYRAWFEAMPVQTVRTNPRQIFRRLPLGRNADLFLVDGRQYRDRAAGSMLGPAQKNWLVDGLTRSRAAWKLVASNVMMMGLDRRDGEPSTHDTWDGYAAERAEILGRLADRGVQGVSFQTGDAHRFCAGTATTTGRVDGRPAATEFVGGSISSRSGRAGLIDDDAAAQERAQPRQATSYNPHLAFDNRTEFGYAVVEARPNELHVAFRATETVTTPRDPSRFTLARFRVARGSTAVERL